MQEYLPLILFVMFFVLPIVERVLKGGRKAPPPEEQPPARRRTVPRGRGEPLEEPAPMRGQALPPAHAPEVETSDAAADMIPDDLWEILTGERRTRPTPAPVPREPEPQPWEVDDEAEAEVYRDEVEVFEQEGVHLEHQQDEARRDALQTERERGVHTAERAPLREAPLLSVFDASRVPTSAERHAAFHRRIDAEELPTATRRSWTLGPVAGLSAADMRRAVLMREILGPPKSLE